MEARTIIWTERAKAQLEDIYKYIAETSILEADKVFDKIVDSTDVLPEQPERYPPDKFKNNNKDNYRAYEIFRYRISYRITQKYIYIVRVRSTDQNPKPY